MASSHKKRIWAFGICFGTAILVFSQAANGAPGVGPLPATPAPQAPVTAPRTTPDPAGASSRRLVIAGVAVGGVGLLLAGTGYGTFAGIHVGNPGPGLSLDGDTASALRTRRIATGMEVVGLAGGVFFVAGAVLAVVGAARWRRERPLGLQETGARLVVLPGLGSLTLAGQFKGR